MSRITPSAAKAKAQRMKVIVVNKLLKHIEADEVSVKQLSHLTKISQERICVLLNPCVTTLDLFVLVSICFCLGLSIRINGVKV